MTQAEFDSMVTSETKLYQNWLKQIELISGYLKQLQDSGVVILWRKASHATRPILD